MKSLGADFCECLRRETETALDDYVPLLCAVGDGSVSTTEALQKALSIVIAYCDRLEIDISLCAACDIANYLGEVINMEHLDGRKPFPWFVTQLQSQLRPHGITGELGVKLVSLSLIALTHSHFASNNIVVGARRLSQYIDELYPIGDDYIE